MKRIDNVLTAFAGLMAGSAITAAAETASAEEASSQRSQRPLVDLICEGQPDMPDFQRPRAGCQLWRDIQHAEDLLEFDSVNPLTPQRCNTYYIVRYDGTIDFSQSYVRFEIPRDRPDYARLGVLLQHYARVLGVEDCADFAEDVLAATRRDNTVTDGEWLISYDPETDDPETDNLVVEADGETATAAHVGRRLNIPLSYLRRSAALNASAEEGGDEDEDGDSVAVQPPPTQPAVPPCPACPSSPQEQQVVPGVVPPVVSPDTTPVVSPDTTPVVSPGTISPVSGQPPTEAGSHEPTNVTGDVSTQHPPQPPTNRPRNAFGFGVPYLHVDGLNMAGAALSYVHRLGNSVANGGLSITYVTDGVSGDSYNGPNSRRTEANPADPFGTTSVVTESFQDTHHILTAGPRMVFDLTSWLSLAASFELGIEIIETNGTVTEALYLPSGAELDSNRYDLEPVRHVNGIGLVRLGPHFGGRRAGAGIEGIVSLDFEGNFGYGAYAGVDIEW
jgi:hypothetical protein